MNLDKGGTIYVIPSDTFNLYRGFEWYSKKSVKPIKKIIVKSGLEAMIDRGVQVYFVSGDRFKKLREGADNITVLKGVVSENEKRGLPIQVLNFHRK